MDVQAVARLVAGGVVAVGLLVALRRLRGRPRPRLDVRDAEWGVVAQLDALVAGSQGPVPVLLVPVWPGYVPGTARPSQFIELGAAMLACGGIPGRESPAEGRLRIVDAAGQRVPGGDVRVPFSPELRTQVSTLLGQIRQARAAGAELHRGHYSAARCRRCPWRGACGEEVEE